MHMDETPLNFNIRSNLTINHTEVNTVKVRTIGMKKNCAGVCWLRIEIDTNGDFQEVDITKGWKQAWRCDLNPGGWILRE